MHIIVHVIMIMINRSTVERSFIRTRRFSVSCLFNFATLKNVVNYLNLILYNLIFNSGYLKIICGPSTGKNDICMTSLERKIKNILSDLWKSRNAEYQAFSGRLEMRRLTASPGENSQPLRGLEHATLYCKCAPPPPLSKPFRRPC